MFWIYGYVMMVRPSDEDLADTVLVSQNTSGIWGAGVWLQIINLMLSCRGVDSPARRAPLRGERHWRGAAAAQSRHYVITLINYYFLQFCLFLNFNFYIFNLFYVVLF